jgi:putative phosphoribosyl transferase
MTGPVLGRSSAASMGVVTVTDVGAQAVHIGRPDWSGEYECVAHPLGVVALPQLDATPSAGPSARQLSNVLHDCGFATLVVDLLPLENEGDMAQLSQRLVDVLCWLHQRHAGIDVGLFGTRLVAQRPGIAAAVVTRSASPALVGAHLSRVQAATLLIVGDDDAELLQSNRAALRVLTCSKRLEVVPGAGLWYDELGASETVAHLAGAWFLRHLAAGRQQ